MTDKIVALITSKAGWLTILAGISWLLTNIIPIVPSVWGNLITAILGVLTFYHVGTAVAGARAVGAKGI